MLEALHEIWPEAPVYSTVYLPEFLGPHLERFKDWNIITSPLQYLPFVHKLISPIRLLTPWVFENWDFSEFDAVIVSATGAYSPNLIVRKPRTKHFTYCHTPPRYLYGYPTARNWKKHMIGRIMGNLLNHKLRQIDFLSYQRPDYIIANSHETESRIRKFYRRESTVIYPPVTIESRIKNYELRIMDNNKRYYLTGGRLARAKRIDLVIEACNRLKLPLKIYGRGFADYDRVLRKLAGPTIQFLGEVTDEKLKNLYKGAKALIYCSEYEDFGIIPVEAQSYGVAVIGLNQGGVKETVLDGKTGILFNEPTVEGLVKAIKSFDRLRIINKAIRSQDCMENAKRFNKDRFKKQIKEFVSDGITRG